MTQHDHKWVVSWDFAQNQRPPTTFYDFMRDEFGPSDVVRVHGSVVQVNDDWTMARLLAHLRAYGASTVFWGIDANARLDASVEAQAQTDVQRLYASRLSRRGRKKRK